MTDRNKFERNAKTVELLVYCDVPKSQKQFFRWEKKN